MTHIPRGFLPINVLESDIIGWMENHSTEYFSFVNYLVTNHNLNRGIVYHINDRPILYDAYDPSTYRLKLIAQTPRVIKEKNGTKTIELHEVFLAYLWSVSYSMWVIYDYAIVMPTHNKSYDGTADFSIEPQKSAKDLFIYGISLIKEYKDWPANLPSPKNITTETKDLIEKTNGIFLNAISFIIAHELAHVSHKHLDNFLQYIPENYPKIKEREKDADTTAINILKKSINENNAQSMVILGSIIATASLLYFGKAVQSPTHPDKDDRIKSVIESFELEDTHHMWGIAALTLQFFNQKEGFGFTFTEPEHYKELFYQFLEEFKKIKTI